MYCTKCGQKLPDDAVFCTKCGTKINGFVPVSQPETVNQLPQTPTPPPDYQHQDNGTTTDKSFIAKIFLLLVVVGGLLAYLYSSPITKGDFFARVKFFRGEPVKVEKNIAVMQQPVIFVDLYEYPDVTIITDPSDESYGFNRIIGFTSAGKYVVSDFSDLYQTVASAIGITVDEKDKNAKAIYFVTPLDYNRTVPLKLEGNTANPSSNNPSKDKGSTVAGTNPTPSLPSTASKQDSDYYPGTDIWPPGSMRGRITGTNVNMRSGPGLEHNVIGSFDKGEIFVEIDNQMSKKDTWVQVRRKNGSVGWVSGQFCEVVKDPNINYPKYIAAVWTLYSWHDAITKKDYKKAYNLLAKPSVSSDQFGQGYSDVISWTVMETYPRSTDGPTVSVEYLFEAKDKTPSGISVKYYKGFADLQKINGEWKIVQESVGRGNLDRKTLLR